MERKILHIARQPIFDRNEETIGYELLYRASQAPAAQGAVAPSPKALNTSLLLGIEQLAGGRRAFLSCTHDSLVSDLGTLVPADKVVLEIPPSATPDEETLAACRRLKSKGYVLALDGFLPDSRTLSFMPIADILKIDVRRVACTEWANLIRTYAKQARTVALKVETRAEYQNARQAGFTYFQGAFFCKPDVVSTRGISPLRMNQLRLLKTACNPDLDFRELEQIVKSDAALCYRLLRYMNSAAFYVHSSVNSIRHALALLGEREIRKWIAVTAVSLAGDNKPKEVVLSALLRARFCELLSAQSKCRAYDLFVVGLFSIMDAILDEPLERILIEIEIPPTARAALLGKPIRLRDVYSLVLAYVNADWTTCHTYRERLKISEEEIADAYMASVHWVDAVAALSDSMQINPAATREP